MSVTGSITRGVAAGAVGTLAMDLALFLRYKRKGGDTPFPKWESSDGIVGWEHAPAPAQVGKRFVESVLGRPVPARYARLLNNVTHWGFGIGAGAGYGLILGTRGEGKVWYGPSFGAVVWGSGYVVLPQLGVYKPIWKYGFRTLEQDLRAHLVFGTATAAAFELLSSQHAGR